MFGAEGFSNMFSKHDTSHDSLRTAEYGGGFAAQYAKTPGMPRNERDLLYRLGFEASSFSYTESPVCYEDAHGERQYFAWVPVTFLRNPTPAVGSRTRIENCHELDAAPRLHELDAGDVDTSLVAKTEVAELEGDPESAQRIRLPFRNEMYHKALLEIHRSTNFNRHRKLSSSRRLHSPASRLLGLD